MRSSLVLAALPLTALLLACGAAPAPTDGPAAAAPNVAQPAPPTPPEPTNAAPADASTTSATTAQTSETSPTPEPAKVVGDGCPDGMVRMNGGDFVMGPLKVKASIDSFCMDRTEVTAEAYAACVKSGQCNDAFARCADAATYGVPGKEKHPMVCVDYAQADTYCKAHGKRLPREDEWEWAARGGEEGRAYPWGAPDPKDQLCWSGGGTPRTGTCEVGTFPAGASPQGIQDLSGNVFEWTTSANDGKSKMRVARGGSWRDGIASQVKVARPGGFEVTYRCGFLGIRCVTPAPEAAAK
ncbi:formylglycine-generating enzyme family protein [Chondromyces crocatus]|uniref:Sulfatase-modifying factor enzyme-like domain-containing protein n=1 Tax=Chondromyces crocatus TaxID=52 RepID=A0A0K1E8U6_CHOCO|nr:SUMF1/EgtB/PvdO family nonheme iron enzyme [Chondromyces crocatus]AKT37279.1 uncharacterized protein CMC5_014100 [Chondromyces crocatus]